MGDLWRRVVGADPVHDMMLVHDVMYDADPVHDVVDGVGLRGGGRRGRRRDQGYG
ncbi:MAG TPA: hypothetical protein VMB34_18885 [Acetobacteraceae bacterium]|nr:hypothetical protein [Acetobacteraceae bacterium]